ncbi:hypothetical protein HYU21_03910 [Candidatus Woesearchaeota archaeon]|nr:hypothetical protein [Candidatus Woesearchaeota archaeon]
MKIKIIKLLALLSLLLVLTACGNQTQTQSKSIFLGGTEGLEINFESLGLQEEGIDTIYDTEDFPLELSLKNKGEESIPVGKASFRLIGPAQEDFEGIPAWTISNTAILDKKSEFNPDGGLESVTFTPGDSAAKYKRKVTGFIDVNWNVEYSYDYKTHLLINDVCFKGDIRDKKVCEVKGTKTFAVSGAPLTVTKVEQDMGGKGVVTLKITVQNAGGGESASPEEEFNARYSEFAYEIDEPEKWECKSGGRENKGRFAEANANSPVATEILCKLKTALGEDDIYTKTLGFTLKYKYKELVQEKLRIKESVK